MDIFPIWKSTFYESESDSVKFRILKWGVQEICRATAVRLPDDELLRIGLNKPCQNFLDSNIDVSATGTTSSNAYAEFSLQIWNESNSQWFNAYEFAFVNDWSYGEHDAEGSFSEPINGHAAPGQLIPYSVMSTGLTGETICYDEYDFTAQLSISPTMIVFDQTGGTATLEITSNSNWYITQYGDLVSLSQTSGTSGTTYVVVRCNENTDIWALSDTLRVRADNKGTTAIEYVHITQAGQDYFKFITSDWQTIPSRTTSFSVSWETNYPEVVYVFDGNSATTSFNNVSFTFPENTDTASTVTYSVSVYTTGGTLVGVLHWRQNRKKDLSEYEGEYLTFDIISGGTIQAGTERLSAYYSLDGGSTWVMLSGSSSNPEVLNVSAGDRIKFKGIHYWDPGSELSTIIFFSGTTAFFNAEGNIMSLQYGDDFAGKERIVSHFGLLFAGSNIVSAEYLCLPKGPTGRSAYTRMFEDCYHLTTPPVLPSTSLGVNCYAGMFNRCYSLTTAPELPATALADGCYAGMFEDCRALTLPPVLPARSVHTNSYNSMFYGCTSLTNAPDLPAVNAGEGCYKEMFRNCYNLLTAPPSIPLEAVRKNGCAGMFYNCYNLTKAPELPSTSLEDGAYYTMFNGCSSLVTPPEVLPTIKVPVNCYTAMFERCTSLTKSPDIQARTLGYQSFNYMFRGCSLLSYIKCMLNDAWPQTSNEPTGWVDGVSENGVFVKRVGSSFQKGINGIPRGWTVVEI